MLKDKDDLAAVLSGTTNEVTNVGYARKVLTNAELVAPTISDVADSVTLDVFSDQVFTPAAGDSWRKMLVCFDGDTTAGTDANILPITAHDLLISGAAVVPNGQNLTWILPSGFMVCT